MDFSVLQHLPQLNFVEIVCLYLLFDVKNSINKLSCAIDKLSDKVSSIDNLERKVTELENKINRLL